MSRPRRARAAAAHASYAARLAASLLVALLLCATSGAQQRFQTEYEDYGLTVEGYLPWPEKLDKGYAPIYLDLANASNRALNVAITASADAWFAGGGATSERSAALEPGERRRVEMLLPSFQSNLAGLELRFLVNGSVGPELRVSGESSQGNALEHLVVLSSQTVSEATVAGWRELVSTQQIAPPGGSPEPNAQIASLAFEDMPTRFEAYTSLDAVVIDTSAGLPKARLDPLLAWVRLGGLLVLAGEGTAADLERVAAAEPRLSAWIEPRFRSRADLATQRFAAGQGELVLAPGTGELFTSTGQSEVVRDSLRAKGNWVPNRYGGRARQLEPEIPGLEDLPYRALIVALILIGLLVGPVNFTLARRLRRPALVLLTIPLTALVTSLGLIAYGFFHHGIDVKTSSVTLTYLDQRARTQSTAEVRQLFAGFAPGGGLRPGPGTICFPAVGADEFDAGRARYRVIDSGGELRLAGDYLPTRTPIRQLLLSDTPERRRLEVRPTGAALSVENALEASVEELLVRDPSGSWFRLAGPLANGASASLVPADELQVEAAHERVPALFPTDASLPPGCYLARLANSPFRDESGLDTNELEGRHYLVGILPLNGEAWK